MKSDFNHLCDTSSSSMSVASNQRTTSYSILADHLQK